MMTGEREKVGTITCPCCEDLCDLMVDKNRKTFFTCHRCGLQPHSRGKESTRWMYKLSEDIGKKATAKPSYDLCPNCGKDVGWSRLPYHKHQITLESSSNWLDNDKVAIIRFLVCPECGFIVGAMIKK
ncbi:hypothetical protein ACFLVR_03985 [Chloroflexota bacterium]